MTEKIQATWCNEYKAQEGELGQEIKKKQRV